jgi:hypothetical protein
VSQVFLRIHDAKVKKLLNKVEVHNPTAIMHSSKSFVDPTKVYGYAFKGYHVKIKQFATNTLLKN